MMKKGLLTLSGIIVTGSMFTFAFTQTPPLPASTPVQTPSPGTTQPPQTPIAPPQTQIQTGTQTQVQPATPSPSAMPPQQSPASNLPTPPPQSVANQAFNSFAQQPQQTQPNSGVAQPPPAPGNLPPLSSLIENTPPGTGAVVNPFMVYGFVCTEQGTECRAVTSYGLVSKGQRISTHQYVTDVTPYSVVVESKIKIGKKWHREYHTYSLFQSTGTFQP